MADVSDGTLRGMRVYLGSDHAGYELKVHLVGELSQVKGSNFEVVKMEGIVTPRH